jgi:glycosyltransferase involved in cell wall biosynthesis
MSLCSVVIPAFNVRQYIAKAIESALDQTYPSVEVIVVNDGSTDDTDAAIRPFIDRIIYVTQDNRGLAAARNRGLEKAKGEYIALLDGDDIWLPNRLEKMVDYLQANREVGFITSDAYLMYGNQPSTDTYYSKLSRRQHFHTEGQDRWILLCDFVFIMTVIRRELFSQHGIFDETLSACADWDLWIRFITEGEKAGFINEPLGYYRLRSESLSTDRANMAYEELAVLEKALGRGIASNGIGGRVAFARGRSALIHQDKAEARRSFAKAFADRELDIRLRVQAGLTSLAPNLAWRVHRRLTRSSR